MQTAEEHGLRAELRRLRDASVLQERADELGRADAGQAAADELAEARSREQAATGLNERLVADNAALTLLLNQQAALLESVRESMRLRREAAAVRSQLGMEDGEAAPGGCEAGCACEAEEGPFRLPRTPHRRSTAAEAAGESPAASPSASPAPRRSPGLLGALWNHVAGYESNPRGRAL